MGDDLDLLGEAGAAFLEEYQPWVADIEAKLVASDALGVQRAAHKLKGALLALCADEAQARAAHLEMLGGKGDLAAAPETFGTLRVAVDRFVHELRAFLRL